MRTHAIIGFAMAGFILAAIAAPQPTQAACSTPLPDDVDVVQPDSSVPAAYARFVGKWGDAKWDGKLCHTLVVESVDAEGNATVVYSYGVYTPWDIYEADWVRTLAEVSDEELQLDRFSNGARATYWFSDDKLKGKYLRGGGRSNITLSRID